MKIKIEVSHSTTSPFSGVYPTRATHYFIVRKQGQDPLNVSGVGDTVHAAIVDFLEKYLTLSTVEKAIEQFNGKEIDSQDYL